MSTGDVVAQFLVSTLSNPGQEIRSARRSLFGAVDHAESAKFVKEELEKQCQHDQDKWNFDFDKELPLNGVTKRYEWETVEETGEHSTTPDDNTNGGVESQALDLTTNHSQTRITDFMRKRKHSSSNRKPEDRSPRVKCFRRLSS